MEEDYSTFTNKEWITKIVQMKANGDDFNAPLNSFGWNILMCSTKYSDCKIMQQILNSKDDKGNRFVDINFKSSKGGTALSIAANMKDKEKILLLLTNGADVELAKAKIPNKANKKMLQNLYRKVQKDSKEFIMEVLLKNAQKAGKLLKEKSVNVNMKIENPFPSKISEICALIIASETGQTKVVDMLLKHPNIDVNIRDNLGVTALICASENGHLKVVDMLLNHPNIDVNIQGNNGVTALILATQNGHKAVIELLLSILILMLIYKTLEDVRLSLLLRIRDLRI